MFAKQINVQKADANWDELLVLVRTGTEINIMQGDETIAKIVSADTAFLHTPKERILGVHPGSWMSEDFDKPISDIF